MYARLIRPAAALVAACGAVSGVLLLLDGEPRTTELDPEVLRYTMVAVLGVFGVVPPALVAVRGSRGWPGVAGMFLALVGNAVALGGKVAAFPQTAFMIVAVAVSLLGCTAGLMAIADVQASKPPQSRF